MPPLIGTLAAIVESYFRITTPFAEVKWPSKFDSKIGFLFEPSAELRYTNHLDFWMSERINSLGFADREPMSHVLGRGCHAAFIGDSMVEAAQVRHDEKVQALLEKRAATAHPERRLTASAFGYSGTGQLNQLTFYDSFLHNLRPKLVVLVFTSNDFANNSYVLEALRNGWHPDHPPRLFARRDPRSGEYRWIPIDPDWQRYLLKTKTQPNSNNPAQRVLHSFMKDHSLFYNWFWRKLSLLHPEMVSGIEGPTVPELIAMRMEALREMNDYRRQLRNWDNAYGSDLDADALDLPRLRELHAPLATDSSAGAVGGFRAFFPMWDSLVTVMVSVQFTLTTARSELRYDQASFYERMRHKRRSKPLLAAPDLRRPIMNTVNGSGNWPRNAGSSARGVCYDPACPVARRLEPGGGRVSLARGVRRKQHYKGYLAPLISKWRWTDSTASCSNQHEQRASKSLICRRRSPRPSAVTFAG